MENVILQPTGNGKDNEHFQNTILKGVSLDIIKGYVDDGLYTRIKDLNPDGRVRIWGVTNGERDVTKRKWEKIKTGDVVFFAQNKKICKSAVVTLTFINKALAERLWGIDDKKRTWENIYLVDELENLDITYDSFNRIVGYDANYAIRGFTYLDDLKSEKVWSVMDFRSLKIMEDVSTQEYEREINRLSDESDLDIKGSGISRKEQSYLRKILFHDKVEYRCGICGRMYPVDLLITAHIKKRSECTKEERLDAKNIVMPMCKFGCDDLYEKGYLLVEKGIITPNKNKRMTGCVEEYIDNIKDNKCDYWNERTEKYFESHNQKFADKDEI